MAMTMATPANMLLLIAVDLRGKDSFSLPLYTALDISTVHIFRGKTFFYEINN